MYGLRALNTLGQGLEWKEDCAPDRSMQARIPRISGNISGTSGLQYRKGAIVGGNETTCRNTQVPIDYFQKPRKLILKLIMFIYAILQPGIIPTQKPLHKHPISIVTRGLSTGIHSLAPVFICTIAISSTEGLDDAFKSFDFFGSYTSALHCTLNTLPCIYTAFLQNAF